jgi:hypothetical protein
MASLQNQKNRCDCSIAAPQKTTWKQQHLKKQLESSNHLVSKVVFFL